MSGAMVRMIDVPAMAAWIAEHGVETLIERLVSRLRDDFLRWEDFDKTARVASHSERGVIELMPVSDGRRYTFKYVNGHPDNPRAGLQTVTAFGVLADVATGYPVLIAEMTLLTALRTAATSALAASVLARPDSRVLALIGTGSQAEFQALAFRRVLGIERLRVWDTDPAAMDKFERNARALGFDVVRAGSAAEAVAGADIVTTCTADKALATVLTDDLVTAGMHLNAIGGDCPGKTELDPAILRRAAVFAEYLPQSRIEGEIQHLEDDFPAVELWQVLSASAPGRTAPEQVTVFDSVGFAVEDFSALCLLADEFDGAEATVDLVADPRDPKDLFSLIAAAGTER
ncbi:ornithine cyclodeaminase [Microbacterium sp. ZW T5_56]|uniref:ornithine cyclodeaminase n=1 Tax=Microbacterium sp. ZW T5_56 TaxID=3378081 RepID=UPI00385312CA